MFVSLFRLCYFLLLWFFINPFVIAKTIRVPDDAPTVKDAVEMAASGDEILLDHHAPVSWNGPITEGGVVIVGKNLTIASTSADNRATIINQFLLYSGYSCSIDTFGSLLLIEDAHVVLFNLDMDNRYGEFPCSSGSYYAAPIRLISGSLTVQDCVIGAPIHCKSDLLVQNSTLKLNTFGTSFVYSYSESRREPGLRVESADNISVTIDNCTIGFTGSLCPYPILVNNIHNSELIVTNTQIAAGHYAVRWPYASPPSSPGFHVVNSTNLNIDFSGSTCWGGNGRTNSINVLKGGDGLLVENSEIVLCYGYFIGGKGSRGFFYLDHIHPESLYNAGQGGTGLALKNSHVLYKNISYKGGSGGDELEVGEKDTDWYFYIPPGLEGEPLSMDDISTFQEITDVDVWEIY